MKRTTAVLGAAVLVLTAACGGAEEAADDAAGSASEAATSAADEATDEASDAASEGSTAPDEETTSPGDAASSTGSAAGTVLIATVGTEEDPEAFEIALTDESGEAVTELPAGDYEIQVSDPSTIHNFHLTGGGVDEATSVPETGDTTWSVTLEPGEYDYVCDPHPPMSGSFTVT